ncbi:MAG: nucleoside deaminase [Clostridia bacterium]
MIENKKYEEKYENRIYETLEECIKCTMDICASVAIEGVSSGKGGPFGAAIVQKVDNVYKIISIAQNTVVKDNNPTSHAEMNAIKKASEILGSFELKNCILITTAKSCPMCLATSCWARISEIYYGVGYEYASKYGFIDSDILEYLQGKNSIIKEINLDSDVAKKPFEEWANKEDRVNY